MQYKVVNFGLHLFHFLIIFFSLIAWVPDSLRPFHLALQLGVLMSWMGYGLLNGDWGRCVITNMQWYWKEKNNSDRPTTESYIEYWVRDKFKLSVASNKLEKYTISTYVMISALSLVLYLIY